MSVPTLYSEIETYLCTVWNGEFVVFTVDRDVPSNRGVVHCHAYFENDLVCLHYDDESKWCTWYDDAGIMIDRVAMMVRYRVPDAPRIRVE